MKALGASFVDGESELAMARNRVCHFLGGVAARRSAQRLHNRQTMSFSETSSSDSQPAAKARVFALTALALLTSTIGYVTHQGYRALTDAFVAPLILSPQNDQVVATRLQASQIAVDKARTAAEIEAVEEALIAGQKAIARLKVLQRPSARSLGWTNALTRHQANIAITEEQMLKAEHDVLADMVSKQNQLVNTSRNNLSAGLIAQSDFTREVQTQNQLRLALLENERTQLQASTQKQQAQLARQSLDGQAPPMPEVMMHEEQNVRVDLEIMRLESEQRSKQVEKRALTEKLATLEIAESQVKQRPLFRAIERPVDAAFVPYTQLTSVAQGAVVMECVWGIFNCRAVGEVTEIVPGEVTSADPWGTHSRGQYAILTMFNHEAAKGKTLRIRTPARKPSSPAPEADTRVSVK